MNSVFSRLAVMAVLAVLGLVLSVGQVQAYNAGDVVYMNVTSSNYAPGSGTNFTVTVTLTDFFGNGVTGKAGDGGTNDGVYINKVEDIIKSGPTTSFPLADGTVWSDNGDGTYTVSGNITGNSGDNPYYLEIRYDDPANANISYRAGLTVNVAAAASSTTTSLFDSAPDFAYYPSGNGTVIAKVRLLNQDGSGHTGTIYDDTKSFADIMLIKGLDGDDGSAPAFTDPPNSFVDNGDGTYDVEIAYTGATDGVVYTATFEYLYDSNGNIKLGTTFSFEVNDAQASGGPTGTPGTNPGAPELTGPLCSATAPSDLAANAPAPTQVDLTWTYDGTNNDYYTVFRDSVQIATNVVTGSYTDSAAAANTSYNYTVQGYNSTETCPSADSNTANVTTPACSQTGSLAITAGQTLNGNPINLTSITALSNSSGEVFTASTGTAPGPAIDEQEYFDSADTLNNWVNWTADGTTSGGTGNVANGELGTYNSGSGISGSTLTPSAGTGPTSVHSGSGFIFREESGGGNPYPDRTLTRNTQYDATANELHISFAYAVNGPSAGTLLLEANDGTGYVTEWSQVGDDGNGGAWTTVDLDLFAGAGASAKAYTSGNVDLRFRWTGGTSFDGDMALDTIRTYGPGRGSQNILFTGNLTQAATVDTTVWSNGSTITLDLTGNDATCGTALPGAQDTFIWNSCTETATLTLTPIADPITGDVSVVATGTATGIQVGTSPSPTNASGWVYVPVQDDNTTTVSFYATGTGVCGTLTDSQLNVATDTMAAPTVDAFVIPANVIDTAAPLDVPITTFTVSDNLAVTGYMITETSAAPAAGAAGWTGTAPTSYTVAAYGPYTLYAWAKDAAGNVSLSASASVTVSNCTPTVTALNISVVTNPINYPTAGSVVNVVPTGGTVSSAQWSSDGGGSWFASGTSYTAPVQTSGSVNITGRATEDTCSTLISADNEPVALNYDTRSPGTAAGTASATQTAIDTITVSMPYQGDVNGDATFQVDYKLTSSGTWINGTPTADAGGSPYTQAIGSLVSTESYDVRVTYADPDTVISGSANQGVFVVVMVPWADNPMLHNSLRFAGTTTRGGDWGTQTGYAGGFTCSTCHAKASGNIKRVKNLISFPSGGTMPGGGIDAAVSLLTVKDGTSDFGDDSAAPRASSNKVCEVCHTYDAAATNANGVAQHAADQSVAAGHYDNSDCIKCHQHNAGFKADCTSCHANPPINAGGLDTSVGTGSATAGKHDLHVNTKGYACNTCHTGWEGSGQMPKAGDINIGFNAFGDTTATYDGRAAGAYTAAAGTTVGTGGALTCSSVYCHGSDSPVWNDAGTAVCGSCHGDATGAPTETAGNGDLAGLTSGKKVGKHVKHVAKYACAICHSGAGDGTALHIDGSNDIVFSGAAVGTSYTKATSTCSTVACHSGADYVWDTATPALACNSCHGYPPTPVTGHAAGATAVDHSGANVTSKHGECNTCHGFSQTNGATLNAVNGGDDYLTSFHQDGNIAMNGWATDSGQDAQYQQGTFGCAKACHANDAAHQLSDSALPVQLGRYGSGSCSGCHDGTGTGATTVTDASPHALSTTGYSCEDCHTAHSSGTIEIPNNATVGINYTANGETGISLGSAVATGATEAEICWNCHGATQSEWGTNNNADGITYNYGTLNQSNWVGATWTSGTADFTYKTGAIKSTHSVNSAGTSAISGTAYSAGGMTEALDAVANIRCSYCHDVHDLNTLASDNSSGKPYLRGTWKGNPYNEDGAPLTAHDGNWTAQSWQVDGGYGLVPRGSASTTNNGGVGGYWIDQNSGNPNNGATLAGTAGLCTLCHGSNVDTMDQTTGEALWVGTNGHSSAVIGGTGSAASNIFTRTNRGQSALTVDPGNPSTQVDMGLYSENNRGYSYRGTVGYSYNPLTDGENAGTTDGFRAYAFQGFAWGSSAGGSTATISAGTMELIPDDGASNQSQFHTFNCGKCHNPHASRLPKLMITNCLDTNHNTWQDGYQVDNSGGASNGERAANWFSAQNCHRRGPAEAAGEAGSGTTYGSGWNKVTPW